MPDNIKDVLSNSTKLPASWNKADEPSKPAPEPIKHSLGDQDCPVCHGIGFVYKDVPLTHPDYGKMVVCECRQRDVRQLERKRLYELSNLGAFSDKTFETFQIQGNSHLSDREKKSLEDAYEAVHNYASHPENGWLVLLGKYGCGKTHLAAAVANLVVDIGIPTIFLTVPDLLDWLRNSYGSKEANFEDRFTELRTVKLLVLDDLGTQNATEWAKEKLFQIINYRYVNNLPTIVTSNENIDRLDGRIKSRLQDTEKSTIIHINAPDYRNPKALAGNQFLLSSLHLHEHQTFSSFLGREDEGLKDEELKNLQHVYRACIAYAEKPNGWLVLIGPIGSGKTHLAAATGNYCNGLGIETMFIVVPDLLDHLRATFSKQSSNTYDEIMYQVRDVPLLILDDLGSQNATEWAKEKLFQLINHRHSARLPTVITSTSSLENIEATNERLYSRLVDGNLSKVYALVLPGYHKRLLKIKGKRNQ